jgi:hypothetical protein
MPTYRITRWKSGEARKPLETHEVEAGDAGMACNHLGWKLFECSFQLISGDLDRWATAKERIRSAYQKTPVIAKLPWGDYDNVAQNAYKMDDIELIEAIAIENEQMADIMKSDAEALDIEERLTDTYLLVTFAIWRELAKNSEYTRSHCRYCDKTGELIKWEITIGKAIEEDRAPFIYVCLTKPSCWRKALDNGYTVISNNRRCYVERLAKQGMTQQQIQEVLRVSRATVSKDFRILNREGKL